MTYIIYYGDYEYEVEQNYLDILGFEFNKKFNEYYDPYYTLYTPEQKAYVKDFETKWLKNEIHEYDYYTTHNYDFLNWLKDKYESEAEDSQLVEEEDLDADDWWDGLDYTTKDEIKERYQYER